jgi:AcrR family transcriptional regulator
MTTPGARLDPDRILDAVRDCVLAVGVRRTTLSDVARRASVSRMTIYRNWPDVRTLVGDLMTREWRTITDAAAAAARADAGDHGLRGRIVAAQVAATRTMRDHPLLRKIIEVDPELLLVYLLHRRGASQDYGIRVLEKLLAAGQADGTVRPGEPSLLARAVFLTTQSFALSGRTMADTAATEPGPAGGTGPAGLAALDGELAIILDRYLAP